MTLDKHLGIAVVELGYPCALCKKETEISQFCNYCGCCFKCCPKHLFTIGYGGLSSIEEFIEALYRHHIVLLADIRRKGTKAYLNCFSSINLANNLYSKYKIHYVHLPELANYHNKLPMKKHPNFKKSLEYLSTHVIL